MPIKRDNNRELNFSQIKDVINQLKKWLGKFDIQLTGGEPLIRPDALDIIKFSALDNGIWTHISSNGYIIDEHFAKKIVESGINSIGISLDALDPSIHDFIKNKPGSCQKAKEAIYILNKYRKENKHFKNLSIQTIITNKNLSELKKLLEFAKSNNLSGISYQPLFQNFGEPYDSDWYKRSPLWPFDLEQLNRVIDELIELRMEIDDENFNCNSVEYFNLLKSYFIYPNQRFLEKCTTEKNIYLNPNGDIFICPKFEPIGNVLRDKIYDIWYSKEAESQREKIKKCRLPCTLLMCIYDETAI
jgi:MoaA/NifB/PqqE/SkfB family radical SAM enzyme